MWKKRLLNLVLMIIIACAIPATPALMQDGEGDITIASITLTPSNPKVGEAVDIAMVITNSGTGDISGTFKTYLYIDPAQTPPEATTETTSENGWGLGLTPGADFTWTYTDYAFDTEGEHTIYVWADRDNTVAESNDDNNLSTITVQVGDDVVPTVTPVVTPTPDIPDDPEESPDVYEPDNTCATARDIAVNGETQTHLFQAAGDVDWVKFSTGSGGMLNVSANSTVEGLNPTLDLISECNQEIQRTFGQSVENEVSADKTIYVKVSNNLPDQHGEAISYNLSVSIAACTPDALEDDDSMAAAHSLTPGSASSGHTSCPAGDEDWVQFSAQASQSYVIETSNLGTSSDTLLTLYDTDGATVLDENDDYGYGLASHITWEAPQAGTYYIRAKQSDDSVVGSDTSFDLTIANSMCTLDDYEVDNGPTEAKELVAGTTSSNHTFCADPNDTTFADQDWLSFTTVAGTEYRIETTNLGINSDTILTLYDTDGTTVLDESDDYGNGNASSIRFVPTSSGPYYARITPYNHLLFGADTSYDVVLTAAPGPTATPTPTTTPGPAPTATPTPHPSGIETLIIVNRQQVATLYGEDQATSLMAKLDELAANTNVQGRVVRIDERNNITQAYADWNANQLDIDAANNVSGAIRNYILEMLNLNANVEHLVIVGSDNVIPHRRVPEKSGMSEYERSYASKTSANTAQRAALEKNMILTDDYYADREPTLNQGSELYLPDYSIGRLIETPSEIIGMIDAFLANPTITPDKTLVTGYDFVQDAATAMQQLFEDDGLTTDATLIGPSWPGSDLRTKQLNERFDIQSINGHANHAGEGTPDKNTISASDIAASTNNLAGALIFTVGCHAGFNDTGELDLAQAFAQKQANYVGNTGYGWGGGGIILSEALMHDYNRELLEGASVSIGNALALSKQAYFGRTQRAKAYDEKVLMQTVLYGLPMYKVETGATLSPSDPFPNVDSEASIDNTLGSMQTGTFTYNAPIEDFSSEQEPGTGTFWSLSDYTHRAAGDPVQPLYFSDEPSFGPTNELRGAILLSGTYSNHANNDPVITLPYNEYVTPSEVDFDAPSWYPAIPFATRQMVIDGVKSEQIVVQSGQYNPTTNKQRIYNTMQFKTFYSTDNDTLAADVNYVDGVMDTTGTQGNIKVEVEDESGINRVVVTFTDGKGIWQSHDLILDETSGRWAGSFTPTDDTRFYVQVVDNAGNVSIKDKKGYYYFFASSIPFKAQNNSENPDPPHGDSGTTPKHKVFLPLIRGER